MRMVGVPVGRPAQAGDSCAAAETVDGSLHLRGLRDRVHDRRASSCRRRTTARRLRHGSESDSGGAKRVTTFGAFFPNRIEFDRAGILGCRPGSANREDVERAGRVESTAPLRRRRSTCAPSPPLPMSLSCRVRSRIRHRLSGAAAPRLPA